MSIQRHCGIMVDANRHGGDVTPYVVCGIVGFATRQIILVPGAPTKYMDLAIKRSQAWFRSDPVFHGRKLDPRAC